eukprot:TRINITY_DN12816_c0_g1_i1.p1 TRINITY_DN12816_c0_g1~~TRINITY_DN12816_c0_g1_i1.p1  ORF type:complete len:303 (-),score=85.22 TRINITY_DN12816_c0_g1_i1:59-946(-)
MANREDLGSTIASIKARTDDIKNRLADISIQFERNPYLIWPELLDQYMVLSTQFQALNEGLGDAFLEQYVFHPQIANPMDPKNAEVMNNIPELLRTKTLPEIEEFEGEVLREFQTSSAGQTEESKAAQLDATIQDHNTMCGEVQEAYNDLLDQLNLKAKSVTTPSIESNEAAAKLFLAAITHGTGVRQQATASQPSFHSIPPQPSKQTAAPFRAQQGGIPAFLPQTQQPQAFPAAQPGRGTLQQLQRATQLSHKLGPAPTIGTGTLPSQLPPSGTTVPNYTQQHARLFQQQQQRQ